MVQQHPAHKHPLFVHKAFISGATPVLIVPAVYLLGYFCLGAGPQLGTQPIGWESMHSCISGQ